MLSNVVPQDVDNNGDFWNRLEIYCRDLTKKGSAYPTYIYNISKITISSAQFDDVRVISGPLWLPGDPPTKLEVKSKYEIMRHHVTLRHMKLYQEDSKLEDCQGEGDGQSGQKKSVSSRLKELRRKNKVVKHEVCNIHIYINIHKFYMHYCNLPSESRNERLTCLYPTRS